MMILIGECLVSKAIYSQHRYTNPHVGRRIKVSRNVNFHIADINSKINYVNTVYYINMFHVLVNSDFIKN
jgi:hypothetical protein